jgi:hypothetical protein
MLDKLLGFSGTEWRGIDNGAEAGGGVASIIGGMGRGGGAIPGGVKFWYGEGREEAESPGRGSALAPPIEGLLHE